MEVDILSLLRKQQASALVAREECSNHDDDTGKCYHAGIAHGLGIAIDKITLFVEL